MKRTLFFLTMLFAVLLCRTPTAEAITYGAEYYRTHKQQIMAARYESDPLWLFINEVETTIAGTTGMASLLLTPGTAPSSPSEGMIYANDSGNNLQFYNGSAWVDIDVSGASSLDTAYNTGNTIDVDGSAVTLTVSNTDNNRALDLVQNDTTNNPETVRITNTGSGDTLAFVSTGGKDIDGTGSSWSVTHAGVGTFAGIILGGTDLVMENADTFNNVDDDVFEFATNDKEDFEIDLSGTNIVKFTSDSAAITLEFDTLDRLTGIEDITFDAEAGNITLTADAVGEDLTISQAGAVDASLILTSEGTGTDALSLITSNAAGDMSLVSADNITRTAADDITDVTTDGTYTLTIGGATNGDYISTVADTFSLTVVDAVLIRNTEASKNITVNSVLGSVVIEGEEDAANAVLITADGGTSTTLKIHNDTGTSVTEGAASVEILSDAGGVELRSAANLANAISLTSDGGTTGTILVYNDQGTSTTEKAASIQLLSDAGSIELWSGLDAADAINIMVDGSTASGVTIFNDTGSGADSINFLTDIGGITGTASAGPIVFTATGATAGDMTLTVGDDYKLIVTGEAFNGVDGTGFDTTWYGDTSSSKMVWDQNGDTNGSLVLTGASQTITGIDSGGNLLTVTGIDTTGNTDTVVIAHSGTGDGLQITATEADSVATRCIAAASQTTSLSVFDAATSNWDGADNIGMVHIYADDPLVHTGASLLQIVNSGQPIASAEGFLARFVDTGTARTTAYAVEIETTNTTPALKLNNQMSITGADSAGVLFDITAIDTTGNSDTMTITHSGTGAAIKLTSSEADTQLLELVSAANQTTWLGVVDGVTGNWIGADNIGMLHLKADTALAHAGASQLVVINTAQPITAAEGFLARFVDTGTARTNAYAIDIEVTDTTGGIYCDGHSTFTKGLQTSSQSVTATDDGLLTGLIPDGASFVTVTSSAAAKVVVLPTGVIGNVIRITVPATGAELQTLAASNDTINGVDCDGTNEMAMAAGSVYELVCVADSKWIAYAWGSDGAAQATIVPDVDS